MTVPPVPVDGAMVGVLGLGRSGVGVTRLLTDRGARVYASDTSDRPAVRRAVERLDGGPVAAEFGRHDVDRLARCDWLVVSPGIPPSAAALADSAVSALPAFSEPEVASWWIDVPITAITGTNGKTTTTAMIGELGATAGRRIGVAGNIGRALSAAVLEEERIEWWVVEVSSFQLGRIATFRPHVAIVLNLTPDHLDVYDDVAAYAADKARIAENQGPDDHLGLNAEDPELATLFEMAAATRHGFDRTGPVERGAMVEDGWITLAGEPVEGRVLAVDDLPLPGHHNVQNALAAALAGSLMGLEAEAIAAGLRSFSGVPHRLEVVAEIDGVRWVNDSKATNIESALVGLEAYDRPLIAIVGGRHKGSSYRALAPTLEGRARRVLAIGEAADRIAGELDGTVDVEVVGTLETAVERARELAERGDVVLLSPACSSYDQFESYEERGDRFRELVRHPVGSATGGSR